ncbi:unnamed protein product, partial [Ascophyllum nodosum]
FKAFCLTINCPRSPTTLHTIIFFLIVKWISNHCPCLFTIKQFLPKGYDLGHQGTTRLKTEDSETKRRSARELCTDIISSGCKLCADHLCFVIRRMARGKSRRSKNVTPSNRFD